MELEGQIAVVIGGATGIGSGLCRALAARGARVHLCDIDLEGAEKLVADVGDGRIAVHPCDVTHVESLVAAEVAIRVEGPVSFVFVNAGAIALKPILESTAEDWRWLFEINLFGTVKAIQAFLPGLLAQEVRSRLVVTSSIAALRTPEMPGQTMYMASKTAQLGLCNGLRTELEGTKVDLSVVFPGAVRTAIRAKSESRRPGTIRITPPANVSSTGYIEPEVAGERIVRAVIAGQPFITTHPGEGKLVRAMQDRIMGAFEE
jgi:NAD(P)-dependent dehydrogenase (short-subunit alcohol dehydrogenase family)